MTFNIAKFRELSEEIVAHEKDGFWSDWTKEQQDLYMSGDWEAFSRSRGYSEDEINTFRAWLLMKEEGDSVGANPLQYTRYIFIPAAIRNIRKDIKGEILKSSHIPSTRKIAYEVRDGR